jgi:wyosine [tRNA(Phe)-imidazoG37] synthetase (radical SAM superfamily)
MIQKNQHVTQRSAADQQARYRMRFVFGPVPSRRLGNSLGIDTIPLKTCNWNCVYCQLGRSQPLVNERRIYFPTDEILSEVEEAILIHEKDDLDWVTFVGSGEPTLHSDMGCLIRGVKAMTDLPIAVITNGSLLYLPEVREELSIADAILPTLDAGSPALYRRLNRPHADIRFELLLEGLITFREVYLGKLWVEVMLIKGLNDTEQALIDLAQALQQVGPDKIHITLPVRPPAETWVEPSDEEGLMRARAILGEAALVVHPAEGTFTIKMRGPLEENVLSLITRHPMHKADLGRLFPVQSEGDLEQALQELKSSGRARVVDRLGTSFWTASPSNFPDEAQSSRTKPARRS